MATTWNLTPQANIEVAIDDDHTRALSFDERDALVDALLDAGAKEVVHYGTIIPTFEDTTVEAATATTQRVLSDFFETSS
ncbi:hypothetical protein [Pseudophaeobacter sp. 1A09344]|uniref:hypothetical protein n=1 Tax=Pseudophaeobacter sp. 1A09344 TaxID=3098144 RepID=UPI0034D78D2E